MIEPIRVRYIQLEVIVNYGNEIQTIVCN